MTFKTVFLAIIINVLIQTSAIYYMQKKLVIDRFNAVYVHNVGRGNSLLYLLDFGNVNSNSDNVVRVDMFLDREDAKIVKEYLSGAIRQA